MRNISQHKYLHVVAAVFLSYSIPAERVVVESRVLHECDPFFPARGNIGAIVLVQILSKKGCVRNRWAAGRKCCVEPPLNL